MNKIWPGLMIISILWGLVLGDAKTLTATIFESAKGAIENCINVFGIIALWSGIMKIAEETKIIEKAKVLAYPIIKLLFPELKKDSDATACIAMNMAANMIGLGNVATPLGIKAMEELQKENPKKDELSRSMLMFLTLNMASIQLIPTTVVALRTTYGAENPTDVVAAVAFSSAVAVVVGIILVKFVSKKRSVGDSP